MNLSQPDESWTLRIRDRDLPEESFLRSQGRAPRLTKQAIDYLHKNVVTY